MCIPGEDIHSRWATPHFRWGCAFPVSHITIPGEDVHSQWGTSPFPVRHIPIPSEDVHSRWVTSPFLVRMFIPLWFILTGNGDVPHQECKYSLGMGKRLTGNTHPHQEWGCDSPGMHILTGNRDVPHRECISSPRMHIVYTGWEGCEDHLASIFHASLLDNTENHSSFCWESNVSTEIAGKPKRDWLTPHLI